MNKEQFIEKLRKKLNILEKKELDDIIEINFDDEKVVNIKRID